MLRILQIVPYLPPSISGVGDYALILARALRERHDIHTAFAVANPHPETGAELEGFPVVRLEHSALALTNIARGFDRILLQYVGYGYQKRGCPVWLLRGLKRWKANGALRDDGTFRKQLVTIFHELFVASSPWTSSFWTYPLQRWLCFNLAAMANFVLTNRAESAALLGRRLKANRNIMALPVFSNLGEPALVSSILDRRPQLVIYGGVSRLAGDTTMALQALRRFTKAFGLEQILTFGSKPFPAGSLGLPVKNLGVLTPIAASTMLLQSRAAYLDYFDGYLAKSGIFAAYCAHGAAPILLSENDSSADGLFSGKHFLSMEQLSVQNPSMVQLRQIAENARNWYNGHSLSNFARVVAARFDSESQ